MKLLHTSDWHVGKTLKGRSRLDEQKAVLAEIVELATTHEVDAVLIAGDVYENVSPTADAQKLVITTLLRLARAGIEVIAIAGNHDHGPTFEAYRPLMRTAGIRLIGSPRAADQGGVLRFRARSTGEEAVLATLPFLSQRYAVRAAEVITQTPAENVGAYDQLVRDVLANLTAPFGDQTVNLAMAHLTVLGGRLGGGEREAQSIMEYSVPAAIFPIDAHYVALGHLHRRQSVPAAAPVHYSGAPLAVDFGEQDNTNVVCLVEAAPDTPARVTDLPIRAGRRLRTVTGTVEQLLADPTAYGEDFMRVRVTQSAYAGMREHLLEALPNALEIRLDPQFSVSPHADAARRPPAASRTPAELDADYFALTGPTGSGKSTVIDGLTFALYGSAPRWGRENAIQYALAPTANRCTVRLVFDVAGQRYVVAREVRRIGKQIAQRNARFERYADPAASGDPAVDEPTESLAADPKAVRAQVAELLGLDFEDFCTCVVLPQGDFATFLQASVGQRQDILLKLLGARHYDAIGRLAGRRANDAQARVDALSGELGGYADATAETETSARAREDELVALVATVTEEVAAVGALAAERERAATTVATTTEMLSRLEELSAPADIEEKQRMWAAAEQAYREAGAAETRAAAVAAEAEQALRSGPTRSWLDETLRWHAELVAAADREPKVAATAASAATVLEQATGLAQAAHADLETARHRHDEVRAVAERTAGTVAELTDRIAALRAVVAPTGAGDLDTAVVAARDQWQTARRALEAAEASLADTRRTVAGLPERSALARQRQTVTDYATAATQLTLLRERREASAEQVEAAELSLVDARHAQQQAADEVERVRAQTVAADLRPHLQIGHACPVCDQDVARLPPPLPAPGLDAARASVDAARQRLSEAETVVLRLRTVDTALDTQLAGLVERLAELDRTLLVDLPAHPGGAERDPRRDRAALDDLGDQLDRAVASERAATTARETARTALQQAEAEGQRLASAAQQGWAELHAANGRLTALDAPTITTATLGAAWSSLTAWAASAAKTLQTGDLPTAQTAAVEAEATRRTAAERVDLAVAADRTARESLTEATLAEDRARSELTALASVITQRQASLADRPTADETVRLTEELRQREVHAAEQRPRAQQAVAARQRAESVRERCRAEEQSERATLLRTREGLAGLDLPPLDGDDLAVAWAQLAGWATAQTERRRGELAAAATAVDGADSQLAERYDRIRALLDDHQLDSVRELLDPGDSGPADPTRLSRVPTLVELALERARSATATIVQRRAAADRLRASIATDTETAQVSRTLQQLMAAKRFPQWLADAALDTLVADASASLLQLSGGQFELTHDRGEFFVIDHADADSRRSVKTLSGGETFQASLALALALSDQLATLAAGGRTTLDSIFLDEGFGTLDPDALEIVAGTLENLAQGNRMVGVVTHVAALADRVPIRFEVSRDSRTSTIERVGP